MALLFCDTMRHGRISQRRGKTTRESSAAWRGAGGRRSRNLQPIESRMVAARPRGAVGELRRVQYIRSRERQFAPSDSR